MKLILYLIRLLWWPQWAIEGLGEWPQKNSSPADNDVAARATTAVPRVDGTRMDDLGHID